MSFTGDLEHLPIVDVIQLLHATRKSGILRVMSRKGESLLVFKNGSIVSANHLNNSVRIGTILIERNVITPEILDQTLLAQKNAGADRKPLIIALLDKGLVKEEDAYQGLEQLIEMTIVEILTWKRGTFTLDVLPDDEYRYYPGKIYREINVDTQGVLMDALRIFDEKTRDGQLAEEDFEEDAGTPPGDAPGGESPALSADDLGLADLDRLERKIPGVYSGLEDRDPNRAHRQKLAETAADLAPEIREELAMFLGGLSAAAPGVERLAPLAGPAQSLLFFSSDELFKHAVTTVCKQAGIPVFATNEEQNLAPIIARSLAKNSLPLLVFDSPDQADANFSAGIITTLRRQQKEKYPRICTIQLTATRDAAFTLQAYDDGVRAVIPRPSRAQGNETFVADTIRFLLTFQAYVRGCTAEQGSPLAGNLRSSITALRELREVPEVALALLQFVAGMCKRSVTLIVRETELIAEKGIGVTADTSREAMPALGFRIPLAHPSLFRRVLEAGHIYYGTIDDAVAREHLFAGIGAPYRAAGLLLPLKLRGKTIALIYGDFGDGEAATVELNQLEILANQAELVLENAAFRKKLEKPSAHG